MFLLGADDFGRDVLSRLLYGARTSIGLSLVATLGAWGALYAVTPEMYPTSLRATGSWWAAGIGRLASIVAPLTVPLLLAAGGAPLLFVVFAAFFAIAAGAAWGLLDRRGRALDDR